MLEELKKQNEQYPHLTNLEVQLYTKQSRYSWLTSEQIKNLLENKRLKLIDVIDTEQCTLALREKYREKTWINLRLNDIF